jgi:predicted N-acetyltransferase YhbS
MIVRPETPSDRERSLAIERDAFDTEVEASIVEAVRDLDGSFALVAEDEEGVVAHAQISRAWVGERPVVALGPIAVEAGHRRRGIGSALVRASLATASARGEVAVILLGDPAFYGRFGFEPGAGHGLANPFAGVWSDDVEIAEEDFQVAIVGELGSPLDGAVRWHPAFGEPSGGG